MGRRGPAAAITCPVSTHLSSRLSGWREVLGGFCQTAVGCLCGSETGAQPSVVWRVDGRPVGPHTAFTGSQESHITRPAVAGGRRGAWVGPKMQTGQSKCLIESVASSGRAACLC